MRLRPGAALDSVSPAASAVRTTQALQVISVPAGHPYVSRLTPPAPGASSVMYRPDPDPDDPRRTAVVQWWPPVALDPDWLETQDYDLLHLHFGFDDRTPDQLHDLLERVHRTGRPVVLTVHDLRSPHQSERSILDAQLDVLVPGVDAVITLTDRAATEIDRRWGRRSLVLPHPHVVDLDQMDRLRALRRDRHAAAAGARTPKVVGVAVKSLRANSDPLRILPALETAVAGRTDSTLRVTVHRDVLARNDTAARTLVSWLATAADREVEVRWHSPLSDAELWRDLAGLHVAVLPYRFGTHSGWLEMCHDVGTRVLAPALGCYGGVRGQGADAVFGADEEGVDERSLGSALCGLLDADPCTAVGLDSGRRRAQRAEVAAAHERLYRSLLAPA